MASDTGQPAQQPAAEEPAESGAATGTPRGSVEMDKAGYASELVAYRVIDKLAGTIAGDVREALGRDTDARVLVVDDLERFAGGMALAEIKSQVELLKGVFDEREADHAELLEDAGTPGAFTASPPAPEAMHHLFNPASLGAALAGVSWESIPKVVDAVAGFLGYFGSNYKVTGREMSVAKQALLASTAGSLAATSGPDVFLPNFHAAGASPLLRELTQLALRAALLKTERDLLAAELPTVDSGAVIVLDGDANEGQQGGEDTPPDPERMKLVAKAVNRTAAVLAVYEGFRADWTGQRAAKPGGTDGATAAPPTAAVVTPTAAPTSTPAPKTEAVAGAEPSKLSTALVQEEAERLGITHLLWISTHSAGGDSTLRDRMFFLKDRIGFMGGAAVGYVLARRDGRILSANTLTQFGIIGGVLQEFSEGHNFEDIDYKPDDPRS